MLFSWVWKPPDDKSKQENHAKVTCFHLKGIGLQKSDWQGGRISGIGGGNVVKVAEIRDDSLKIVPTSSPNQRSSSATRESTESVGIASLTDVVGRIESEAGKAPQIFLRPPGHP